MISSRNSVNKLEQTFALHGSLANHFTNLEQLTAHRQFTWISKVADGLGGFETSVRQIALRRGFLPGIITLGYKGESNVISNDRGTSKTRNDTTVYRINPDPSRQTATTRGLYIQSKLDKCSQVFPDGREVPLYSTVCVSSILGDLVGCSVTATAHQSDHTFIPQEVGVGNMDFAFRALELLGITYIETTANIAPISTLR